MPSTQIHSRVKTSPVWMTVEIETHVTLAHMISHYDTLLEKRGIKLRGNARSIVMKSAEKSEVRLVLLTVADLGFTTQVSFSAICKRALESGLHYCKPETVLAARLNYSNQPQNEIVRMCMEAQKTATGVWEIPTLEQRRDHTVIATWRAHPDDRYQPSYLLAFELK